MLIYVNQYGGVANVSYHHNASNIILAIFAHKSCYAIVLHSAWKLKLLLCL